MNPSSHAVQTHTEAQTPPEIVQYYDALAPTYDVDRFGNSYGKYVDAQERKLLNSWLAPVRSGRVLDLACGTGRLLDFATHGLDASAEMVKLARIKFPSREIVCGQAEQVYSLKYRFDAIICFHLFMHLPEPIIQAILREASQSVKPGGLMIFDVPSARRRALTQFCPSGWHGATSLSLSQIRRMTREHWDMCDWRGILFFPVHRLPQFARPVFRWIDDGLGGTLLKHFSSYLVCCLRRKN